MLDHFLAHSLAAIDDLAELKVSLAALRLLERRGSESASATLAELAAQPALRDGLGFAPDLALESALKRAVARGTLLAAVLTDGQPRYFANTEASRRAIEAIERALGTPQPSQPDVLSQAVEAARREIERLESIDAAPIDAQDRARLSEWLARGYTPDQIAGGVREALREPRPRGAPPRGLGQCAEAVTRPAPAAPTAYFRVVVARAERPPDEVIAFRELAQRWPDGREFHLIQTAAGLFGARAAVQALKRLVTRQAADLDRLIPLLAEDEEAQLALARSQAEPDLRHREVAQLFEAAFGLPPTSYIAHDMAALLDEVPDPAVWRGVFEYAAAQGKRDWAYVRRMLLNPSPAVFLPAPANPAAEFAFGEYRRRVGRGQLDASIAREINEVAQRVTDPERWTQAIDAAAAANALNWNYIRKVLAGDDKPASEVGAGHGKPKRTAAPGRRPGGARKPAGSFRRPQVEESTDAERETARERARQRIEERARRRAGGPEGQPGGGGDPQQP
jgi:hypothetical protein